MFDKMQKVNHNNKNNIAISEKCILRKMCFNFRKIAFYIYIAIEFKPFWS